jgi:hypothetical protein
MTLGSVFAALYVGHVVADHWLWITTITITI